MKTVILLSYLYAFINCIIGFYYVIKGIDNRAILPVVIGVMTGLLFAVMCYVAQSGAIIDDLVKWSIISPIAAAFTSMPLLATLYFWWEGSNPLTQADTRTEQEKWDEFAGGLDSVVSAFTGQPQGTMLERLQPVQTQPEPKPAPEPPPAVQKLPDNRTEHMMVLAGSGSGKTQLLQSLLLEDIYTDATIIVIDSQQQLIDNLLHVVPTNRLVHLTPTDKRYPLALNLFDQDPAFFEYIFGAFGGDMTPQMAMIYRYVARLVSVVPEGNLETMRKVLEKNGAAQYRQHFGKLPPLVRDFFTSQFDSDRGILESRQAVLRRVYAALENDAFAAMFTAKENKVNLRAEIEAGKVILIDTAKGTLKGDTFKIFGRFCLAQIAQAIFSREVPYPNPVYIYIDEFADYAGDEGFVLDLFTQARKWNVGLLVAFQFLGQLPEKVLQAVMSNTAIKFVGKVSAPDRRSLAAEMGTSADHMAQQKGVFTTNVPVRGALRSWTVEFGKLEAEGKRSRDELDAIRHEMRQRYSEPVRVEVPPQDEADPDNVDEVS